MRSSVWSVDLCSSDSLTPCPLGRLLVAATLRGVCFVALGTRDGELIAQLHREYPAAAEIARDDELLGQSVAAILEMIDGAEPHAGLPLDIRFTAFPRRVWEEQIGRASCRERVCQYV